MPVLSPVAIRFPSGLYANPQTPALWPDNKSSRLLLPISHISATPGAFPVSYAIATRPPSGLGITIPTGLAGRTHNSFPLVASHKLTVPSGLLLANRLPSALNWYTHEME